MSDYPQQPEPCDGMKKDDLFIISDTRKGISLHVVGGRCLGQFDTCNAARDWAIDILDKAEDWNYWPDIWIKYEQTDPQLLTNPYEDLD